MYMLPAFTAAASHKLRYGFDDIDLEYRDNAELRIDLQ